MKLIDIVSKYYGSDSDSAYNAIYVFRESKNKQLSEGVFCVSLDSVLNDNDIFFTIQGCACAEDYIRQEWLGADVVGFSVLTTGDECGDLVVLISRPEEDE